MNAEDTAVITGVGQREGFYPAYWIAFATEWERWENTSASFNPLAATDSSVPGAVFNPDGVRSYTNLQDGITATVRTLDPGSYYGQYIDYYKTIRLAIKLQSIDQAGRAFVEAEVRKWGTVGFANVIASGWNPTVVAAPITQPTPLTADELNRAIQDRMALGRLANDTDYSRVQRAIEILHAGGFQL